MLFAPSRNPWRGRRFHPAGPTDVLVGPKPWQTRPSREPEHGSDIFAPWPGGDGTTSLSSSPSWPLPGAQPQLLGWMLSLSGVGKPTTAQVPPLGCRPLWKDPGPNRDRATGKHHARYKPCLGSYRPFLGQKVGMHFSGQDCIPCLQPGTSSPHAKRSVAGNR